MNHQPSIDLFEQTFGHLPSITKAAPGRIEILGNHTDYNQGFVLSMAVDYYTTVSIRPLDGDSCYLFSEQFGSEIIELSLADLESSLTNAPWTDYVRGILIQLQKRDITLKAFELTINSNIPPSSGMSSSAALEVALTTALLNLCEKKLPPLTLAEIGQACEHETIGAQTGLLDQLTSLCSQKNKLLLSEYLEHTTQPISFPQDLCFIAINTGVKHDLSQEYNERRKDCETAIEYLVANSLRHVTMTDLRKSRETLPEQAYKRALHIITENERVHEAINYLDTGNIDTFGELLFESHGSSQENFENSCEELDHLIRLAHDSTLCKGARLSGGGFGGISIHLVEQDNAQLYIEEIKEKCSPDLVNNLEFYICTPSAGALFADLGI